MSLIDPAERIQVVATPAGISVMLQLGGVQVCISMPSPSGIDDLTEEAQRNLLFRHARRALTVAREELE